MAIIREKTAAIIRAEGEAEAARLINDAVKSFGSGNNYLQTAMIELRRLEASQSIAQSLSQSSNVTYIPGGSTGNLLTFRV